MTNHEENEISLLLRLAAGRAQPSGLYFARLETRDGSSVEIMVLIR